MKIKKYIPALKSLIIKFSILLLLATPLAVVGLNESASAHNKKPAQNAKNICGSTKKDHVHTKFDLGCNGAHKNPILDMTFALIRFLSVGVGIVVIVSVIFAGIQYTTSQGNPEKTAQAKSRIQTSIMALIFYLFIFAIVQFLVPGGLFG
jgi:heme/copper-type cytochrome/quinol oxidase subunit 2